RLRQKYNTPIMPGGSVVGRVSFAFAVLFGSIAGLALVAESGRASLYSPEDPLVIPVGPDGRGQAIPFGDFKLRYAEVLNGANDIKKDGKINSDREKLLKRIEMAQGKKLTALEAAALAVDLLRVGRTDQALNLIKPKALERNPNYFVLTTLAHI